MRYKKTLIRFILSALIILSVSGQGYTNISDKVEAKTIIQARGFFWKGNKVQVLIIPGFAKVRPVVSRPGNTVPDWAKLEGAVAAINGGYFNHSDGWPVSQVIADGIKKTNPEKNQDLLNNLTLKPILSRIFNERTEWRELSNGENIIWEILPHKIPVKKGFKLVHSLQAGPQLLPFIDLEKEGFIIKNKNGIIIRDGIGSSSHAARSALGLTAKGEILFVAVSSAGKNGGVTIVQLAELMKELQAISAMALDGGSSTTLTWKEENIWKTFVGSGKSPAVVNSALVVLP